MRQNNELAANASKAMIVYNVAFKVILVKLVIHKTTWLDRFMTYRSFHEL